jgi:small conductance mechanosensitive channel
MITITNFNFVTFYDYLEDKGIVDYSIQFLSAILILIIGLWMIRILLKSMAKRFEKSKIDPSLRSFILPLISITLKVALIITVIRQIGVETTSFIALLGTAGLAVGLALQGSLSNFAGGVLILLLKPFKVGDFIEAKGFSGTVKDIHIFYTILATPNNQKVVIPNSDLSNSSVINYSAYPTRRLELVFSCAYDNDIELVRKILFDLISNHELVLKDPAPIVLLSEYGNSSIDFKVRGWVKRDDYWTLHREMMFGVKAAFDQNNITIPFPQLDVHIQKND